MKKKESKNLEALKNAKQIQSLDKATQLELKGGEEFDPLYTGYSQWW
ncbi:MAG: hypothetical protein AB8G15_18220 [Saprospiraceae bacterium]